MIRAAGQAIAKSARVSSPEPGHSAEYFGAARSYWWNQDFLQLMARRWSMERCRKILDVGCGVGHWTRVLADLAPRASVVGVDRDQEWVRRAREGAADGEPAGRLSFNEGRAEDLPFADASFDLVSCQTLLIHVADVEATLREMWRVLQPGGQVCLVEPNNMARSLADADIGSEQDVKRRIDMVHLQLTCELGKKRLGRGFNSAGEELAAALRRVGFRDLSVYTSDKCFSLVPPYASPGERAEVDEQRDFAGRNFWIWGEDETREYFLAGGGSTAEFERLWPLAMGMAAEKVRRIEAGDYTTAGGNIVYLYSAVKHV